MQSSFFTYSVGTNNKNSVDIFINVDDSEKRRKFINVNW